MAIQKPVYKAQKFGVDQKTTRKNIVRSLETTREWMKKHPERVDKETLTGYLNRAHKALTEGALSDEKLKQLGLTKSGASNKPILKFSDDIILGKSKRGLKDIDELRRDHDGKIRTQTLSDVGMKRRANTLKNHAKAKQAIEDAKIKANADKAFKSLSKPLTQDQLAGVEQADEILSECESNTRKIEPDDDTTEFLGKLKFAREQMKKGNILPAVAVLEQQAEGYRKDGDIGEYNLLKNTRNQLLYGSMKPPASEIASKKEVLEFFKDEDIGKELQRGYNATAINRSLGRSGLNTDIAIEKIKGSGNINEITEEYLRYSNQARRVFNALDTGVMRPTTQPGETT